MYTGQCLCGALRFRIVSSPLTVYACHCTDCQRRTGSAFAMSMWVSRDSVELLAGELSYYVAKLSDGRRKRGAMCGLCATRVWGDRPGAPILVVQPGVLDQQTGLVPVAHQWTRSRQAWVPLPDDAVTFETQPESPMIMIDLWRTAHPAP